MQACILEGDEKQATVIRDLVNQEFPDVLTAVYAGITQARKEMDTLKIDFFLLDTSMPDGSGLEFAGWLRANPAYARTPIIFLADGDAQLLQAINQIHCFGYLIKPLDEGDLSRMLRELQALNKNGDNGKSCLTVSKKGQDFRIRLNTILYVETIQKDINIHTQSSIVKITRYSLKMIAGRLPADEFVQCHRSFIVNKESISAYESKSKNAYVRLSNGDRLPVGAKYKDTISRLAKDRQLG